MNTQDLIITNEGRLTDADKKSLHDFKGTEVFRLARKLCANEYHVICEQLTSNVKLDQDELRMVQGELRGIKKIYALLLHHAQVPDKAEKIKGTTLPDGRIIRNIKSS